MPIETLVVPPAAVVGVVWALPALGALAASGRRLAVLAPGVVHPLLRLVPGVGAVLERGAPGAELAAALGAGGFGEAVLLDPGLEAAWLAFRAGIPWRWGYRGGLRSPLLRPAVAPPRGKCHEAERHAGLLAALGVAAAAERAPRLELPPERVAAGRERLERARLGGRGGPRIGLAPGAEAPAGRWPWRRAAELARELRRREPRRRLIILCGTDELWPAVRIHEESSHLHPVVGPDLDLADLAGLLSHLDLVIGGDGPILHLAAAVGVPCLGLYGPTDPERRGPAGDGHAVLRAPVGRIKRLAVAPVLAAAEAALATRGPGA